MANITKNQHYVPRFIIRNFAEKGVVWTYDSSRDLLRKTAPEKVFSENYFYDKDNQVENFLCTVEASAAPRISQILDAPSAKIECPDIDLLRFILVQQSRTPGSYEGARVNLKNYTDSFIKQQFEIWGCRPEEYEGVSIGLKDEKDLLRISAVGAALDWPIIQDLQSHVLINRTSLDFVISDNPVVFYNWYLKDVGGETATSLTKLGVHIFLPISNKVALTFYDSRTYKVGVSGQDFSYLDDLEDVRILNCLQFRNRQSSMIFSSQSQEQYVKDNCRKLAPSSLFQANWSTTEPVEIGGGKLSAQHLVWRTQLKLNRWISIVKVKRKASRLADRCQDRNPQFVAEFELLKNTLRTVRAQRSGSPVLADC